MRKITLYFTSFSLNISKSKNAREKIQLEKAVRCTHGLGFRVMQEY